MTLNSKPKPSHRAVAQQQAQDADAPFLRRDMHGLIAVVVFAKRVGRNMHRVAQQNLLGLGFRV